MLLFFEWFYLTLLVLQNYDCMSNLYFLYLLYVKTIPSICVYYHAKHNLEEKESEREICIYMGLKTTLLCRNAWWGCLWGEAKLAIISLASNSWQVNSLRLRVPFFVKWFEVYFWDSRQNKCVVKVLFSGHKHFTIFKKTLLHYSIKLVKSNQIMSVSLLFLANLTNINILFFILIYAYTWIFIVIFSRIQRNMALQSHYPI